MEINTTTISGLRISYAESRKTNAESLLLLSPLPENLDAFIPIWQGLADKFDLVAVDLPNFGNSQSSSVLLTPGSLGHFLFSIIEHFGLGPVHVIGPDIGTTVALFAAQAKPAKIKSIVAGSAACVYPILAGGILENMILDPTLDGLKKFRSADIINGALDNIKKYDLPSERRKGYVESYADGRFWDTMLFLKSLPSELPQLQLAAIDTPVLILWGANDPLAIPENGRLLHGQLKNSELRMLDCGHYVWEDEHEAYLGFIITWVEGGYLKN